MKVKMIRWKQSISIIFQVKSDRISTFPPKIFIFCFKICYLFIQLMFFNGKSERCIALNKLKLKEVKIQCCLLCEMGPALVFADIAQWARTQGGPLLRVALVFLAFSAWSL